MCEMAVPADPSAVRDVRHTVAGVLDGIDPNVVDRAVLCTSELVTNAIEHGGPPVAFHIDVADDRVRIEVHDGSSIRPRQRTPPPNCGRGRGIAIVERCTDRWGVEPEAGGKIVWCELSTVRPRRSTR